MTSAIVTAARAFLATLSASEQHSVLFDWTNVAQKQRWSNFPTGGFKRAGLMWGDLSESQQHAWLQLMQATLSNKGYNRVMAQWEANDIQATREQGPPNGGRPRAFFGKRYHYIALIGTPAETEPWQWQWGGHHVTLNATIVGGHVALTPSFIGVQPGAYTDANDTTVRPLGDIEDDAFALINALDATQQQAAIISSSTIDLMFGPGDDGKTVHAEGLAAAQMTIDQQAILLRLISHYVCLVNDTAATARMAEIQSSLDQTFLAWYGATTQGSAAYFRITGPTLLIEYAPQGNRGNPWVDPLHVHGIYRDPTNDYGAKYAQ